MSRTDAGGGSEVSFVAHVAVAEEGADSVDALAVTTRILQHLALVDVCWKERQFFLFFLIATRMTKLFYQAALMVHCCKSLLYSSHERY